MQTLEQNNVIVKSTSKHKPSNIPLALRFIAWGYPKVERIAPQLAHRWFVNLFFSPPRYPIPKHERHVLQRAEKFSVQVRQHDIQCYSWGDGPVVLMVHGWAGRASQFRYFIEHFVASGYRVVSFDSLGHGFTKGKQTTIIDFKDAILKIEKQVGIIDALIGHSLGGGACLFALSEGLNVNTVITIATPTLGDEIIDEFANRIGASAKAKSFLKKSIYARLNKTFDEFMSIHFIPQIKRPLDFLVLHDEHDREASLKNAEEIVETYPQATFIKTSGLGHVRILKDERIMLRCREFIQEKSSTRLN